MDLLSLLLIITAGARLIIAKKRVPKFSILVFILGMLLFVSWLRGTGLYGLEASTNAFRPFLYFYSTLFFTISLEYSHKLLRLFTSWLGLAGWVLIAIALARWTLVGLGLASSPHWVASGGWMIRVIGAAPTFLLLQTLILHWYTRNQPWKIPFSNLMPYLFLPAILILQHRTVWVALAFTAILVLFLERKVLGVFLIMILSATILAIFIFGLVNFSVENLSGTALDLRTITWRILSWQALIAQGRFQTPLDFFIGQPLGTGYARYISAFSYEITYSPHNFYIQTFLNIGGLGLATLLALYGSVLKSLWDSMSNETSRGLIALLAAQLVYCITYAPSFEQGFILGLALLVCTAKIGQA